MGAKLIKKGHNPVSVAAKAPVTTVAKWFPRYPINYLKNSLFITVMLILKIDIK
jgi:uncharacterized protein YbgA (DUF1722 family)